MYPLCERREIAIVGIIRNTRDDMRIEGDYWAPLEAVSADKVATQKDILEKQLGEDDVPENEIRGILQESKLTNRRWGSERSPNVDREKSLCRHRLSGSPFRERERNRWDGTPGKS